MKKPKRRKPRKAIKPEVLVFDKTYLNTVEEMLASMALGVGASRKHRQRYIDLLIQNMKEVAEEKTTLH